MKLTTESARLLRARLNAVEALTLEAAAIGRKLADAAENPEHYTPAFHAKANEDMRVTLNRLGQAQHLLGEMFSYSATERKADLDAADKLLNSVGVPCRTGEATEADGRPRGLDPSSRAGRQLLETRAEREGLGTRTETRDFDGSSRG